MKEHTIHIMDHFNVTVQKDGALVSTRRGLQVTKHKYHGISFVNTSGPSQPSSAIVGTSGKRSTKPRSASKSAPGSISAPSGFSTFSVAQTPTAETTEAAETAPKVQNAQRPQKNQKNQKSQAQPQIKAEGTAPLKNADPSKPLVHRWKLVTKPATKAKRESNASSTASRKNSKQQTPDPLRATDIPITPTTASTPAAVSDTASLPSPLLATPPPSAPGSSLGSRGSSPSLTQSTSTSPSLSPFETLLASPEWDAEYISPIANADALQPSSKQEPVVMNGARRLGNTESKVRKARITALINSYQQVDRSLPTWTMSHIPQLNKFEQRLFHQFFQLIPRKLYPFEDLLQYNPARSSEFYWMVVQDRAAVRCVLLCGAMFRAMLSGANNSDELAMEVSNVCRIVNQQLARQQQDQKAREWERKDEMQLSAPKRRVIPDMTLECITTLALMGGSTGRYDHWHLHMQALSKMVELNGGSSYLADDVRPALLFKMRKTDLKGAMALALRPYLPYTARKYPNISDSVLLDMTRRDIAAAAAAVFADSATGISTAVGRTLGELCVFVQAVQLCADLAKAAAPLPLDPYCFSEELYWLQYHLVSQPGPFREEQPQSSEYQESDMADFGTPSPSPSTPRPNTQLPVDTSNLETESYVRNHRAPLAALFIVPAALAPGTTVLEPVMRICGILYLKEYFPDFPRNIGGYAILLHMLRYQLSKVDDSMLLNRNARAMLVWACLMGDAVSRLANVNEQRYSDTEQYDRSVFRDRLVDLISTSPEVPESTFEELTPGGGVDGLLSSDWAVCRLLDLSKIHQQGVWNDRQGVLNIVLEGDI
ncbi:hypothetical protein F503_07951 [Ophiostoma piceae UAMH 11346]|uniref:Uncharacterized protein n=1 Tax=Ophiostoma piceae (strain UAMH 11346) TaxID=1262450 RepID=S3D218_OPHP1|nr:hypothetical protein F503_07951 [Ophiostoma piceae UAMH 11346]